MIATTHKSVQRKDLFLSPRSFLEGLIERVVKLDRFISAEPTLIDRVFIAQHSL